MSMPLDPHASSFDPDKLQNQPAIDSIEPAITSEQEAQIYSGFLDFSLGTPRPLFAEIVPPESKLASRTFPSQTVEQQAEFKRQVEQELEIIKHQFGQLHPLSTPPSNQHVLDRFLRQIPFLLSMDDDLFTPTARTLLTELANALENSIADRPDED